MNANTKNRVAYGIVAAIFLLDALTAQSQESVKKTETTVAAKPRYTFSWPLGGDALTPRGGTTRGVPVVLDQQPSLEWQALTQVGLKDFERDRRAILAMAGTYRVTFDFLEVMSFATPDTPVAPYQSWGTEKVYVDIDGGTQISLVHILEMRILKEDGSISEPMVTKHWRQDWQYQPKSIVEYQGRDQWQQRSLRTNDVAGQWSQTVYQVDESPRYASVGRWQHSNSFSTWLSGDTRRPLPRREWSVREDYQLLTGTNRHTIYPTGWVQEENNLKTVLTADRHIDNAKPYLAREYGLARYQRIRDADFKEADSYYEQTKLFWQRVQQTWSETFAARGSVTLKGPVDKLGLFKPLFEHADEMVEKKIAFADTDNNIITAALRDMGALK